MRKIHIESRLSREAFETKLKKGINTEFKFFPREIIYGKIVDHEIKGVINPPYFFSDAFKNRVSGLIKDVNGKTEVDLTVRFGLVNWIIVSIWFIPLLFITQHEKSQEFGTILNALLGMSIFSIFCGLLLYLKLRWDSNRMKRWIEQNCLGV